MSYHVIRVLEFHIRVLDERIKQLKRWSLLHDKEHTDEEWSELVIGYANGDDLRHPQKVKIVKCTALALAALESRQPDKTTIQLLYEAIGLTVSSHEKSPLFEITRLAEDGDFPHNMRQIIAFTNMYMSSDSS